MSAFVVDKRHISAILDGANLAGLRYRSNFSWYYQGERHYLRPENINETGQMLLDENIKSVSYRYEDSSLTNLPGRVDAEYVIPYRHTQQKQFSIIQYIKFVNCLDYQSCEHPDYKDSEAKCFMDALRESLVMCVPGYEESKWELIEV